MCFIRFGLTKYCKCICAVTHRTYLHHKPGNGNQRKKFCVDFPLLNTHICTLLVRYLFYVLLVFFSTAAAFTLPENVQPHTDYMVQKLMNCEFDHVFSATDSLIRKYPHEPLYPLMRLFAFGLRDLDFAMIIDTLGFLHAYEQTIQTLDEYEKKNGTSSYVLTLSGFTHATHASFYLNHKQYFAAMGTGLSAIKTLQKAKEDDSTNYDVNFFLGAYKYAKADLRKKLWMLLFWYSGSKKQGIQELKQCSRYAKFAAEPAKMMLADIYLRESDLEKSKMLLDTLSRRYPQSRFILWGYAKYYEKKNDFQKAAHIYDLLAQSYEKESFGVVNGLETRLKQIGALSDAGLKEQASEIAQRVSQTEQCTANDDNRSICRKIRKFILD